MGGPDIRLTSDVRRDHAVIFFGVAVDSALSTRLVRDDLITAARKCGGFVGWRADFSDYFILHERRAVVDAHLEGLHCTALVHQMSVAHDPYLPWHHQRRSCCE